MSEEIARVFCWRSWQRDRVCVSVREKGGTCNAELSRAKRLKQTNVRAQQSKEFEFINLPNGYEKNISNQSTLVRTPVLAANNSNEALGD